VDFILEGSELDGVEGFAGELGCGARCSEGFCAAAAGVPVGPMFGVPLFGVPLFGAEGLAVQVPESGVMSSLRVRETQALQEMGRGQSVQRLQQTPLTQVRVRLQACFRGTPLSPIGWHEV